MDSIHHQLQNYYTDEIKKWDKEPIEEEKRRIDETEQKVGKIEAGEEILRKE